MERGLSRLPGDHGGDFPSVRDHTHGMGRQPVGMGPAQGVNFPGESTVEILTPVVNSPVTTPDVSMSVGGLRLRGGAKSFSSEQLSTFSERVSRNPTV